MKSSAQLAIALLFTSIGFAGPPDRFANFIYYETGFYAGPNPRPRYQQTATIFFADGSYSEIYFRFNEGANFDQSTVLGTPGKGTYTYRKIDDSSAELVLDGTRAGILQFDSATSDSGKFVDPKRSPTDLNGIVQRTFRIAPLSSLSPLANCSNRSFVRPGGTAFTGFVISGTVGRVVLVRAVGPGLAPFGVSNTLRDPVLQLHSAKNSAVWTNDDWSLQGAESIRRTSIAVGAFTLPEGSRDAATIVPLPPGAYIVEVSSTDSAESGEALIEVYVLP